MAIEWIKTGQDVSAISSALINLVGLAVIWYQIRQTNRSLKQSYHTSLYSVNAVINKVFIEKPELRPYFYDINKEPVFESKEIEQQVFSIAELYADHFESIFLEQKSLSKKVHNPWKEYMSNLYRTSPAFRRFMALHQNQYSNELCSFLSGILVEPIIKVENSNPKTNDEL